MKWNIHQSIAKGNKQMTETKKTDHRAAMLAWLETFDLEQKRAVARMAETNDGAVGWLLKFMSTNLDSLGAGGWQDLRHDLSAFAAMGHRLITIEGGLEMVALERETMTVLERKQRWERGWEFAHLVIGLGLNWEKMPIEEMLERKALPDERTVRFLQGLCREIVIGFAENGRVSIPNPNGVIIITTTSTWIVADGAEDAFKGHLAEIVKAKLGHLKKCEECGVFYLANRTDQRFCSVRCQGRVGLRKFRNAQSEKSAAIKKQIPKKPRSTSKAKRKPTK